MTMHTRCPYCHTVFRIRQQELEAADGHVRCGICNGRFDARRHLQAALPLESETRDQPELDLPDPDIVVDVGPTDRRFLEEDAAELGGGRHAWGGIAAWSGVNVILLLVLVGQLLFVQRDVFAQEPALRPVLERMCEFAGCELPARRAIDQLELARRNVYSHPNVDDALIIEAEFVNRADFAQPFPVLTVTLGDLRGRARIRRHFTAEEYLDNSDAAAKMAPGAPARILLEVHDPGPEARTFELDFS